MELNEALFSLLHTVRNTIIEQVKQLDSDLSPMHLKSLKVISKIDDCTGQKLATFMVRDKAQINRLIKELVNQELVIKSCNENDGRSQILSLSSRGKKFIDKFNKIEKQVFETMLKDIEPQEVANFIELAKKFKSNLK
ncbi:MULTISPECIES: MarR family winged helix-turn-helix transcriptional regulator [Alteromonadaceae]|uniref:MarR family winged helix-turn-helix transcriptional regulator n=1 Tax=Alteromonadaceae TaxID=72275 RepID=UPI001C09A151|nr:MULTISPECIES: MarR family transcriptional regulator [Aliiglaciecola]MBU2876606.1 MarR family transcriptional regulator [Aliiglaciecola lipolytica]MDO6711459.1 MarR family transcriptional regulator [Aliiglaciecola sp. 2_MG-2023]MDO6752564.1 MarR family transcriptional regulator [Aliiglaciecola sp. 1_MG-2023]